MKQFMIMAFILMLSVVLSSCLKEKKNPNNPLNKDYKTEETALADTDRSENTIDSQMSEVNIAEEDEPALEDQIPEDDNQSQDEEF